MSYDGADFAREFAVSRETLAAFERLAALIAKWNRTVNLVAPSTVGDVWDRHFRDSARLCDLAPPEARTWTDLGSGGGFPGLPVALIARDRGAPLALRLVESDQRKCAFLREAARALALDVAVAQTRIEAAPPAAADVVSARALAPLPKLLALAEPFFAEHTIGLFAKGENALAELTDARLGWHIDGEAIEQAHGHILRIRGFERRDPA